MAPPFTSYSMQESCLRSTIELTLVIERGESTQASLKGKSTEELDPPLVYQEVMWVRERHLHLDTTGRELVPRS